MTFASGRLPFDATGSAGLYASAVTAARRHGFGYSVHRRSERNCDVDLPERISPAVHYPSARLVGGRRH